MTVVPAQVAGVKRYRCRLAEARPRDAGRGPSARSIQSSIEWAARKPSPRWLTAPNRFPRVDKIVGPGNLYVTAAKKLVAFDCAIDMLSRPYRDCGRQR